METDFVLFPITLTAYLNYYISPPNQPRNWFLLKSWRWSKKVAQSWSLGAATEGAVSQWLSDVWPVKDFKDITAYSYYFAFFFNIHSVLLSTLKCEALLCKFVFWMTACPRLAKHHLATTKQTLIESVSQWLPPHPVHGIFVCWL